MLNPAARQKYPGLVGRDLNLSTHDRYRGKYGDIIPRIRPMDTDHKTAFLIFRCRLSHLIILLPTLYCAACGGGSGESAGSEDPSEEDGNQSGASCQMTEMEAQMLAQVNAARSQARNCGSTSYAPAAVLDWDCKLAQAAAGHSGDMAQNNFFSHTGSDGMDPGFRIDAQGYQALTWGENIAAGYESIDSVIAGWLTSPGHCANIMNASFSELGMAFAEDSGSDFDIYWTQVFAAPAATSFQFETNRRVSPQGRLGGKGLYRYPATQ